WPGASVMCSSPTVRGAARRAAGRWTSPPRCRLCARPATTTGWPPSTVRTRRAPKPGWGGFPAGGPDRLPEHKSARTRPLPRKAPPQGGQCFSSRRAHRFGGQARRCPPYDRHLCAFASTVNGRSLCRSPPTMPPTAVQAPNAWRVLFLLFLANLFNFFDRTIPAIVTEPVRREWNLSDLQIGLFGTAFTLIYALAGIPLGRLADSASRARIMGWGLTLWSGLTALNGLAWNYWSFLLMRMGVGIGYAPAANSLIGDLFPADRRARAMGLFMLGLPLGLTLAFFTVG